MSVAPFVHNGSSAISLCSGSWASARLQRVLLFLQLRSIMALRSRPALTAVISRRGAENRGTTPPSPAGLGRVQHWRKVIRRGASHSLNPLVLPRPNLPKPNHVIISVPLSRGYDRMSRDHGSGVVWVSHTHTSTQRPPTQSFVNGEIFNVAYLYH